jgi:hypothetical protein
MRRGMVMTALFLAIAGGAVPTGPEAAARQEKAPPQKAPAAPLEGTRWSVMMTPDAAAKEKGEASFEEVLIFEGGKVTMTTCQTYGFAPSPYTATTSGDIVSFMTRQSGSEAGKSTWTGDFKGNTVNGTMVWTKPDETIVSYAYAGKKVTR